MDNLMTTAVDTPTTTGTSPWPELRERQLALEEEARTLGIQRYRTMVAEAVAKGREDTLPPAHGLIRACLIPLVEHIKGWREELAARKQAATKNGSVVRFLDQFETEQLAYITSRVVLSSISTHPTLRWAALEIARLLEDELSFRRIKEEAPGLFYVIQKQTEDCQDYRRRRTILHVATSRAGIEWIQLPPSERVRVGVTLIDMLTAATGLVEIKTVAGARNKRSTLVYPTEVLNRWLDDAHSRCELLNPVHLPMVHPPIDWTSPYDGGYLTPNRRHGLIKSYNRAYLEELESADLSRVYGAINALQRVPWQINRPVYDTLRHVWEEMGGVLGKLPSREQIELPAKPVDIETNAVTRKEWARAAAKVHTMNANMQSKRIATLAKLNLAEKFVDDTIYYPWSLDWRGRAYPIPGVLHPQGDDVARGLLRFAEGKPLGVYGVSWLKIHIANLFGVDKVSFEERIKWVEDHDEALMESAMNPIDGQRFWTTADKPWQALAACYEWLGYKLQGPDFVSHLPIAMDGSCNGLQHFSAMLRDPVGGAAVNLIPGDQPHDIYARVAAVVIAEVEKQAGEGNPMAIAWLGRINRSVVKRPVMTLPYGATKIGMRDQLIDYCRKAREDGDLEALPVDEHGLPLEDTFHACTYLAGLTYESIGKVVIAARDAMDWLQKAAGVAAASGLPVWWTTPMGLPVCQLYRRPLTKAIDFKLGTVRYQIETTYDSDKVDRKRMAAGISPNFVHSLDAAAMMATIEYAEDNGVTGLAMIHDSYGCHAADCNLMFTALRQAFVDQYTPDVLARFRDELVAQLSEEDRKKVPELPKAGSLDLAVVLDSKYFFA